jgi:hypothetical protein
MTPHRFHLPTAERRKLMAIERHELDALTHRRAIRHEREAARQDASRQALREALRRA